MSTLTVTFEEEIFLTFENQGNLADLALDGPFFQNFEKSKKLKSLNYVGNE